MSAAYNPLKSVHELKQEVKTLDEIIQLHKEYQSSRELRQKLHWQNLFIEKGSIEGPSTWKEFVEYCESLGLVKTQHPAESNMVTYSLPEEA